MSDTRLIERWLPIAELGEESVRERRSMTALPPTYYLHVWWARRPLVASRAAILASLLPADADQKKFKHILGIQGDPLESKRKILEARRSGIRFEGDAYTYDRAFTYCPTPDDREWMRTSIKGKKLDTIKVLDPTAGGGSIPFESVRLGLGTFGNDLNPVAVLIERATLEWPTKFGSALIEAYRVLAEKYIKLREVRLKPFFPPEPEDKCIATNYLWARTVRCPYCEGLVPLSPNWRLAPDGKGVRIIPSTAKEAAKRVCKFEIVAKLEDHSPGTVADGDANCPFPDCGRIIEGDEVKRQALSHKMGEQLYTVVFKRRILKKTKTGKIREAWERGYRAPCAEDDNSHTIDAELAAKAEEWQALDILPTEAIPDGHKTHEPLRYGMTSWSDFFSSRQLLSHGINAEIFRTIAEEAKASGSYTELTKSALVYLTLTLDKLLNYNSRRCVWMTTREVVANSFNRHDFAFCWSFAEMPFLINGIGYDWAVEQTAKCVQELIELVQPTEAREASGTGSLFAWTPPPITLTCKSGDSLDHLEDDSVDCVVMDPPYYDNVMYAELSDFFYVWLKRSAGQVFPELFRRQLTDKENEAVANPSKFKDQKGSKARAGRDYQERMASIFAECRRVLKPDGIMTLMFTHKATGAWDALTKGLMHAGFTITASWPINTEAESSMHIKDKAAANPPFVITNFVQMPMISNFVKLPTITNIVQFPAISNFIQMPTITNNTTIMPAPSITSTNRRWGFGVGVGFGSETHK